MLEASSKSDVLGADELGQQAGGLLEIGTVSPEDTALLTTVINNNKPPTPEPTKAPDLLDNLVGTIDWKDIGIKVGAGVGGLLVLCLLIKCTCCRKKKRTNVAQYLGQTDAPKP